MYLPVRSNEGPVQGRVGLDHHHRRATEGSLAHVCMNLLITLVCRPSAKVDDKGMLDTNVVHLRANTSFLVCQTAEDLTDLRKLGKAALIANWESDKVSEDSKEETNEDTYIEHIVAPPWFT